MLAFVGAVMAFCFGVSAKRQAKRAELSAFEASKLEARIAEDANRLNALTWSDQYFEALRAWANHVIIAMSEAAHLSQIVDDDQRSQCWFRVRAQLSALADSGRWHFPNRYEDQVGITKSKAYRGIRQHSLDCIVDVYNEISETPIASVNTNNHVGNYPLSSKDKIEIAKREFVSSIQDRIDPRYREKQMNDVIEEFAKR
ncbi:MAG: hypothetical protein P1U65_02745 [Minwuia sp.]|nr:hypothetical protein [Minwuia sp.]